MPATDCPSYIAVELRLSASEAEALAHWLDRSRGLIEARVMSVRSEDREPLLAAFEKLKSTLGLRMEPWEQT